MRKILSVALVLSLILALAACGGTAGTSSASAAKEESAELQFSLESSLTKEEEYTADDGTLIFTEKYELPQLVLTDSDGNAVELDACGDARADICRAFNAKISDYAAQLDSDSQTQLEDARAGYAECVEANNTESWLPYANEVTVGQTYMTDTLLSVAGNCYADMGGAHPSSWQKMWNFDLTTGEFITLSTLCGEENPLGEDLKSSLSAAVQDQIREQSLAEGYFDNYLETVNDLVNTADFYFTDSGMVLVFDTYVLAPYAAGPQSFPIVYGEFYYALAEDIQALFALSQEDVICSDYLTAQVYWSWFHMATPQCDVNDYIELDGYSGPLYRALLGNVTTIEQLRALICTRVSEELTDEWLASNYFVEANGGLYFGGGMRGGNLMIGKFTYEVTDLGETGGTLVQTVHYQDYDEAAGDFVLTGETDELAYPFTLANGHAVFTDFPCPL